MAPMGHVTYFRSSTSVRNLIAGDRFLTCSTNAPTQSRVAQGICGRRCHLWIRLLWDTTPARRAVAAKLAKACRAQTNPPRRACAPTRTASAYIRAVRCGADQHNNLSTCAAIPPARQSPINRSFVTDAIKLKRRSVQSQADSGLPTQLIPVVFRCLNHTFLYLYPRDT